MGYGFEFSVITPIRGGQEKAVGTRKFLDETFSPFEASSKTVLLSISFKEQLLPLEGKTVQPFFYHFAVKQRATIFMMNACRKEIHLKDGRLRLATWIKGKRIQLESCFR